MQDFLISVGNDATKPTLVRRNLSEVIESIQEDKRIESLISRIRLLPTKNERNKLKIQLPYFNLGLFEPDYRKNDNFHSTEFFLFDVDGLNEIQIAVLKLSLRLDKTVFMFFVSPSGNGLKIVYRLDRPIITEEEYAQNYIYYAEQ